VLAHGGTPNDYFGFGKIPGPVCPMIALPTTAGTGSEVSHSAVLTDTQAGVKVSTLSNWLRPTVALIDPQLTDSCPKGITAASGIDALVHAIEAYLSRDYTAVTTVDCSERAYEGSYPLTRLLAAEAIRLIGQWLVRACHHPKDVAARDSLALASMLAGMAFSNSGVGVVHALEYPIGAMTHCSHGEGNGLLLPHVMRYLLPTCKTQLADIARWLGADVHGQNITGCASMAIACVQELQVAIGIHTQLRQLGLNRDLLPQVASKALDIKRLMDTCVPLPTHSDLLQILEAAY
jgi:alcohol dehydrogenase class IV